MSEHDILTDAETLALLSQKARGLGHRGSRA
jgi:hypothetical protein